MVNPALMSENDKKVQDLFLDFLSKAREIYGTEFKHESEIDSEITVQMASLMEEFYQFRKQNYEIQRDNAGNSGSSEPEGTEDRR